MSYHNLAERKLLNIRTNTTSEHVIMWKNATHHNNQYVRDLKYTAAYLPKARTVKPQKPQKTRNNRIVLHELVFAARCWITHATIERIAAPRPATLVATQRRGKHISAAVSRHATIAVARCFLCGRRRGYITRLYSQPVRVEFSSVLGRR
jgi:cytochrome c553